MNSAGRRDARPHRPARKWEALVSLGENEFAAHAMPVRKVGKYVDVGPTKVGSYSPTGALRIQRLLRGGKRTQVQIENGSVGLLPLTCIKDVPFVRDS
jgi:hypothetical protein